MNARSLGTLALYTTVAAFAGSCGAHVPDPDRRDRDNLVDSVRVTITAGARGTFMVPLPYAAADVTYALRIEALDRAGGVAPFNGFVGLSVTPGTLVGITGANVQGRNVQLVNGVAESVQVTFGRAYGETRIWAEEAGYVPVDPERQPPAQCANGVDDDTDGRIDFPADFGCAAPNDDSELNGSYAVGSSEPLYFDSPLLSEVQGHTTTSTLLNERITVTRGQLVVTRISIAGLWVTDIADTSCGGQPCYNSIFAFNFRLPEGLRPCDRLEELQGSVQEFVSSTQLSQPAWRIAPDGLWIDTAHSGACRIPNPTEITPTMLTTADDSLEPLESGLVRVLNPALSGNIGPEHVTCNGTCDFAPGRSNCDQNGDNRIDFNNPTEAACANACQQAVGCSEWTNWLRFSQLAVDLPGQSGSATRVIVAPREAISNFDPLRPPATTALAITGTLKQVGPNWIIEPRCTQDLVLPGGTVLTAQDSCLIPRTVTEDP